MCRTDAGAGMVEPARLLFQIVGGATRPGYVTVSLRSACRQRTAPAGRAWRAARPAGAPGDPCGYNAVHVAKLAAHQANGG